MDMIEVQSCSLKNAPTQGSSAVLKGPVWPTLIAFIETSKSSKVHDDVYRGDFVYAVCFR